MEESFEPVLEADPPRFRTRRRRTVQSDIPRPAFRPSCPGTYCPSAGQAFQKHSSSTMQMKSRNTPQRCSISPFVPCHLQARQALHYFVSTRPTGKTDRLVRQISDKICRPTGKRIFPSNHSINGTSSGPRGFDGSRGGYRPPRLRQVLCSRQLPASGRAGVHERVSRRRRAAERPEGVSYPFRSSQQRQCVAIRRFKSE